MEGKLNTEIKSIKEEGNKKQRQNKWRKDQSKTSRQKRKKNRTSYSKYMKMKVKKHT